MIDYKTSRDRLPKHQDDDNVGITFSVILILAASVVAGSVAALI
jgi:hypothetical protein